ncbi:hypothetical protein R1sor_003839 [Riccia sorocarpa]|uniref:Protein AAR2 homolog n=1 Tax=Riccia sorocarpa TaxID=122646 RepID=A0ABD3H2U1_9MARC
MSAGRMSSTGPMDVDEDRAPYEVRMHNADALELVKSAATLLILDMPASTSFGFNTQMFVVGPNFRGLKMILPGPHFVYYSSRSKHGGDSSPVTGFFIYANNSQVIVRRWDPQEERLVELSDSSEEERFALAAKNLEFDRQLAPYDLDRHKIWKSLTDYISPAVIERIEPVGGDITVMAEASLVQDVPRTAAEKRLYEQINRSRKEHGAPEEEEGTSLSKPVSAEGGQEEGSRGRCFYTQLPHLIKKAGTSARELTAMNLDKTEALESLIQESYGGQEDLLLGELQFCFIAFLMGQSLEAFGQWKGIVSLLLRCEEAPLRTRTTFFVKFLGVIYNQLRQSLQPDVKGPSDSTILLEDQWFSEDNFFRLLLKDFFSMLRDASPVDGDLLRQMRRLKKVFESTMGWIFDADSAVGEEDDEYAPVVVYEE